MVIERSPEVLQPTPTNIDGLVIYGAQRLRPDAAIRAESLGQSILPLFATIASGR